jgi:protein TonB
MANKLLLGLSLAAHGGLAVLIGRIEVRESRAATAIEIAETRQKRQQNSPAPAEVREPPPQVEKRATRKLAAKAAEPPPLAAPATPQAALAALPDFGLTLSGGDGAGLALAQGAPAAPGPLAKASAPIVKRALTTLAAPHDECSEPPAKPKPTSVPQPSYTDQARAAGIEGKVRVELTVDESGRVASVRVISGLGHGLDEAAVAAAQRATFQPAIRCGKPARATFTISMRFAAS